MLTQQIVAGLTHLRHHFQITDFFYITVLSSDHTTALGCALALLLRGLGLVAAGKSDQALPRRFGECRVSLKLNFQMTAHFPSFVLIFKKPCACVCISA